MLTIRQLETTTGIKRSLIVRWCRAGLIPGAKRIGRNWWLPEDGVRRLLKVSP